jgi:hypothetical protein
VDSKNRGLQTYERMILDKVDLINIVCGLRPECLELYGRSERGVIVAASDREGRTPKGSEGSIYN